MTLSFLLSLFHLLGLLLLLFLFFLFLLLVLLLGLFLFFLLVLGLLFGLVGQEVSADERLQDSRDSQSFGSLVVLENAAKSSFCGAESTVEHMHVLLFNLLNKSNVTSFFFPPQRMPKLRAWKSVQFEQETSSL